LRPQWATSQKKKKKKKVFRQIPQYIYSITIYFILALSNFLNVNFIEHSGVYLQSQLTQETEPSLSYMARTLLENKTGWPESTCLSQLLTRWN
jgi:hypothetical protein